MGKTGFDLKKQQQKTTTVKSAKMSILHDIIIIHTDVNRNISSFKTKIYIKNIYIEKKIHLVSFC